MEKKSRESLQEFGFREPSGSIQKSTALPAACSQKFMPLVGTAENARQVMNSLVNMLTVLGQDKCQT